MFLPFVSSIIIVHVALNIEIVYSLMFNMNIGQTKVLRYTEYTYIDQALLSPCMENQPCLSYFLGQWCYG